mmetsp:Transcript_23037/g.54601  ORF Transcript_23037/g.54601 Transcript_23037/m.54601 type:complete len:204 (-) Transcript_23037:77-688(-)
MSRRIRRRAREPFCHPRSARWSLARRSRGRGQRTASCGPGNRGGRGDGDLAGADSRERGIRPCRVLAPSQPRRLPRPLCCHPSHVHAGAQAGHGAVVSGRRRHPGHRQPADDGLRVWRLRTVGQARRGVRLSRRGAALCVGSSEPPESGAGPRRKHHATRHPALRRARRDCSRRELRSHRAPCCRCVRARCPPSPGDRRLGPA